MSKPTRRWAAAAVLWCSFWVLLGTSWDAAFEADPDGATDLVSDLDTFIQQFKLETRNRSSVETIFGTGSDDNGLHRVGSARAFIQNAAPTDIVGPGQYNAPATAFGGTLLTTEELGASTDDIGRGRLWVDLDGADNSAGNSDDRELNVWDETANGFLPVRATPAAELGQNLIYNGSFEVTDGTGSLASTTVASGWANLSTATIGYQSINDSTEGDGVAMRTTAAGGANEGARQALNGLKESTTYQYRVRVRPTAGDTCNLTVGDGTTTATDTSAGAGGTFETLEVQHTTTAAPATVNVDLRSTADTDVCDWDHVTAFEVEAVVAPPGIQVCRDTDNSTAAGAYTIGTWVDALVSCSVVAPAPSFLTIVQGQIVAEANGLGTAAFAGRIRENCGAATTVAMAVTSYITDADAVNAFADLAVVPLFFTRATPLTPGTTCTYTLEGLSHGNGALDRNVGVQGTDDLPDSANLLTTLEVVLIPTR